MLGIGVSLRHLRGTTAGGFSPAALFAGGEAGVWYEPSPSTCFTDTAGTTPASVGDAVARIDDLSGNGFHATQATAAKRPILRQSGALYYLEFDGVDDAFVTPTITPGTDKVQVFTGVRKLSDASLGALTEFGISAFGGFFMGVPEFNAPIDGHTWESRGSGSNVVIKVDGYAAPHDLVITGQTDLGAPSMIVRTNGAQTGSSTDALGGNFANLALHIGARGGTVFPFNGHIYSLIVRFGTNLDLSVIQQAESYVAGKTGVTL